MILGNELHELFLDLLMENSIVSIQTLVTQSRPFGTINYKPEYQRNFVWDDIKSTSYIESIIMRTEIPPKIFWYENTNELIDGRQRYETIVRFINNEFALNKNGLYVLKELAGKKFKDLDPELAQLFIDTMVRTLTITMNTPAKWDEYKIDQIKKAIFRRYNMGITPLNEVEIARAKYIDNDLTQYFIRRFREDKTFFENVISLLSIVKNKPFYDLVEIVMAKIRILLVVDKVKTDYLITNKGKKYAIKMFEKIKGGEKLNNKLYKNFVKKIEILNFIKSYFDLHGFPNYVILYEALYWALSVLENEKIDIQNCIDEKLCVDLVKYISENRIPVLVSENTDISRYMSKKLRYRCIAKFFEKYFKLDFSDYIVASEEFKQRAKEFEQKNSPQNMVANIKEFHLQYNAAKLYPIFELLRLMQNTSMEVRPSYQRSESEDKKKSSGIIESILMKFKLLPVFFYIRKDGVIEVIDGQQRLLSIISYLGEKYKNEEGVFVESCKNKFKLQGLEILQKLNGLSFEELSDADKNMILNTTIPVVEIHEAKYKNFKPVDLFIRLNSKPYPIKNHSFEIWNTILPNNLLHCIKDNTKKHESWFYIKNKDRDTRMHNEELYTILLFLETRKKQNFENHSDDIKYFWKNNSLNIRICPKFKISNFLYDVAKEHKYKDIKNNTENFLEKLKILLSEDSKCTDEYLEKELNKMVILSNKKKQRSMTMIWGVWYFVSPIDLHVIKNKSKNIKSDLKKLLEYVYLYADNNEDLEIYQKFQKDFECFKKNYFSCEDNMVLSKIPAVKSEQNNNKNRKVIKTQKIKIKNTPQKVHSASDNEKTVVNVSINVQSDNTKMNNN